jgi:hypothetical protein
MNCCIFCNGWVVNGLKGREIRKFRTIQIEIGVISTILVDELVENLVGNKKNTFHLI